MRLGSNVMGFTGEGQDDDLRLAAAIASLCGRAVARPLSLSTVHGTLLSLPHFASFFLCNCCLPSLSLSLSRLYI